MNTREIAVEFRLSHWAKIVQDQNNSGLSIRAYCKNASIQESSYYYWLKRLREAASEGMAQLRRSETGLAPAGFAEVKLPTTSALEPTFTAKQSHVCIEAAGVRITADNGYPIGNLATLLREVARPC
jgi:transposase-like protein